MPQGSLSTKSHSTKAKNGKETAAKQKKKHKPIHSTARSFQKGTENITSAIHKRIEDLMAGRCVHEGGRLKLIKIDAASVDKYVGGGAKVDAKIGRLLQKDNINRRSRLKKQKAAKPPSADGRPSSSSSSSSSSSTATTKQNNTNNNKKRKRSHQLDDDEDNDVDPLENIVFSDIDDDDDDDDDNEDDVTESLA
jgi:hypothetical protein